MALIFCPENADGRGTQSGLLISETDLVFVVDNVT
jgi:hypothetical protein